MHGKFDGKEKKVKKTFKFLIFSIFILIIILGTFLWLTKREKVIATTRATAEAVRIFSDEKVKKNMGIPQSLMLFSTTPGDINLFERSWQFWFNLKPKGYLEIWISAPRGIGFIPIFNREKDLKPVIIQYHE